MSSFIVPFTKNEEIFSQGGLKTTAEVDQQKIKFSDKLTQQRLNDIHTHLWSAGSKHNISPLHHQKVLQREIILTERSDLHLIWFNRIIYIQPLPDCMLDHAFFKQVFCADAYLYGLVFGFLYSYLCLIQNKSDLDLAKSLSLVSTKVKWPRWHSLRRAVLQNIESNQTPMGLMNKRFQYGELRLARLNYIWRYTFRNTTYFTTHREYVTYFQEFFAAGITLFAFITVALTAMQVVVGMQGISDALLATSYRFSIAILVLVAAFSGLLGLLFAVLVVVNVSLAIINAMRQ